MSYYWYLRIRNTCIKNCVQQPLKDECPDPVLQGQDTDPRIRIRIKNLADLGQYFVTVLKRLCSPL